MESKLIDGVELIPLKHIENQLGDLFLALKASEKSFSSFGEAYFSTVKTGKIKGWKKHRKMILNLVVPIGKIRFVLFDDRAKSPTYHRFNEFTLSRANYARLTVPPGVWMAFQGTSNNENILLNLASIEHDPGESENKEIEEIPFNWN
ncbi:MAG: dTDP-4-dehydrorhamnose 3,5-epimerase family protein [Bdellovibrionota bacterium]